MDFFVRFEEQSADLQPQFGVSIQNLPAKIEEVHTVDIPVRFEAQSTDLQLQFGASDQTLPAKFEEVQTVTPAEKKPAQVNIRRKQTGSISRAVTAAYNNGGAVAKITVGTSDATLDGLYVGDPVMIVFSGSSPSGSYEQVNASVQTKGCKVTQVTSGSATLSAGGIKTDKTWMVIITETTAEITINHT